MKENLECTRVKMLEGSHRETAVFSLGMNIHHEGNALSPTVWSSCSWPVSMCMQVFIEVSVYVYKCA